MTLKKAWFWVIFAVVMPLASCSLEDDPISFHFVNLRIVDIQLPESFKVQETYEIQVTYLKPNNCTFFEGFDITKPGYTERDVVAVGSVLDDMACAQEAEEVVTYFRFTCYYSEPYVFRFWTGQDEFGNPQFIEVEVPVSP